MPLPRTLYCGPSGWSYPHWNGIVYPRLKPRGFHALEDLSTYFDAVEINTSFYQSIRPELASLWVQEGGAQSEVSVHREVGPPVHARTLARRGGDRAFQGRPVAVPSRAQAGLCADAVSLDLSLYRGEPRIPDRAAARVSRVSAGGRNAALQLDARRSARHADRLSHRLREHRSGAVHQGHAASLAAHFAHRVRAAARAQSAALGARVRPAGPGHRRARLSLLAAKSCRNGSSASSKSSSTPRRRSSSPTTTRAASRW